jgi:hypothetical protein
LFEFIYFLLISITKDKKEPVETIKAVCAAVLPESMANKDISEITAADCLKHILRFSYLVIFEKYF